MKKLLLLLGTFIFVGCSNSLPMRANLNPVVDDQPAGIYQGGESISVSGQDHRLEPQVIKISLPNQQVQKITNQISPDVMLSERLQNGFQQQGLTTGSMANATIGVNVEELQNTLTKPGITYHATASSRIKITVTNNGNTLTKEYNRSATQESVLRPDLHDLEIQTSEQLSDIMEQILTDTQIRGAIKGQY